MKDAKTGAEAPLKLIREAFSQFNEEDQKKFEQFGVGPDAAPSHRLIHFAFQEMADKYPQQIAAEHLGAQITYQELNARAEALAAKLKEMGVKPGDHVGLFLQRSISMLVGLMAILKTGAAYVPQDARITPKAQLQNIIQAANIKVVLGISQLEEKIPQSNITFIAIDRFKEQSNQPMQASIEPEATAFILFTSGTTGVPNGVQVTHKNLCNILLTKPGNLNVQPGQRVSQVLNISFDMAAWEIFGALCHGATLVIRGKSIEEALTQVDVVIATPSVLGSVDAKKMHHLETVAVAGEPCPQSLADEYASFCRFYNSCGPTETTIVNTMHEHRPGEANNIGAPTPNNTVYVLDENRQPCPIGEIGELWAGGDCVTKGYLNNDALNADRYQEDPFLEGGRKMFRTRDLGRWTATGELEHFGRTDDQVKIRGFRVELDSVSTALESVHGCEQAVTLKLNDQHLVSFVRPSSVDLAQARRAVEALLPYYCAPKVIISLDEFPKTSRGKVDKRVLTVLAVKTEEDEAREKVADQKEVSL